MTGLKAILDDVRKADQDAGRSGKDSSSYQIYLWDNAQLKHLKRLVGRHLASILADSNLRDLAWLFPSADLLPPAEDATRRSPITLVADVVRTMVAIPAPYHYTLLEIAHNYAEKAWADRFQSRYYEPLSDLVPMERVHEVWGRGENWQTAQEQIRGMAKRKRAAMRAIVIQLHRDLRPQLSRHSAPPVDFDYTRGRLPSTRPALSRLWHEFTRLNSSVSELETLAARSLPVHEREASYKAARLTHRLLGDEATQALAQIFSTTGVQLQLGTNLLIYKVAETSRYANFREGAFNLILSENSEVGAQILDQHYYYFLRDNGYSDSEIDRYIEEGIRGKGRHYLVSVADAGILEVTLRAFDREHGLIAIEIRNSLLFDLEAKGIINLESDVVLDEKHLDTLSSKVRETLDKIGYTQAAATFDDSNAASALKNVGNRPQRLSPSSPADILWEAPQVAAERTGFDTRAILSGLPSTIVLDESQQGALVEALSKRLTLIWGPPGTGKSTTLRAICIGAIQEAQRQQRPLRLLVTANTYLAVDNVLLKLKELLPKELQHHIDIFKIQSSHRPVEDQSSVNILPLNSYEPSRELLCLKKRLEETNGTVVIGTTPQQLHNLAKLGERSKARNVYLRNWFDFVIIDEASQMDAATSSLVVTKLASGGTVVMAGDRLQLPPIHQIKPPKGLEAAVGSIYTFMEEIHGMAPVSLERSYRSNAAIVSFVKEAGYENLVSNQPDLRLTINTDEPTVAEDLAALIDPTRPAVCMVHEDEISGQINPFETEVIASVISHLYGRLAPSRVPSEQAQSAYTAEDFWRKGVGIVTPHRAQMSHITEALLHAFPGADHAEKLLMRGAVDTVERFQGQERDLIFGSFGVGDVDLVRSEEEFLFNLRRFNVMASRAKSKLIVLVTRSLLDYLARDLDVLKESRLLKVYADYFCNEAAPLELGGKTVLLRCRT